MKGYNTRSVWIISAEIRYLLSEQKKFQNKSINQKILMKSTNQCFFVV